MTKAAKSASAPPRAGALPGSREQEWLRSILDTAVEGIITIDEQGKIISFNPSAEAIFGYRPDEIVGKKVNLLMPRPERDQHDSYIRQYLKTGKAKIIGVGREVVGQRKNGETFPMELSVAEFAWGGARFFTGVVRDITERRELEREVLAISERERRRIGEDLHDGLCQHLAGIEFMSQALHKRLDAEASKEAAAANEIASLLRNAAKLTRSLSHGLLPVQLNGHGLIDALRALCESTQKVFDVSCDFFSCRDDLPCDDMVATHLYRIAQEAVGNAIRHGRASRVELRLKKWDDKASLTISDNGQGIKEKASNPKGMGLRIMNHRASVVGGSLSVSPSPTGGAEIVCAFPCPAETDDQSME